MHGLEIQASAYEGRGQVAGYFVERRRHVEAELKILTYSHTGTQAQLGGQAGLALQAGLVREQATVFVIEQIADLLNNVIVSNSLRGDALQGLIVGREQIAVPAHGAQVGHRDTQPHKPADFGGQPHIKPVAVADGLEIAAAAIVEAGAVTGRAVVHLEHRRQRRIAHKLATVHPHIRDAQALNVAVAATDR